VDYASAAGFYEDAGLEVEQIVTQGGGPDLAALISGDVAFNTAAPTYQLDAIRRDRDVILIMNYINGMNQSFVLSKEAAEASGVAADAPIEERLAALKGMTLGITRPGAMTDKHIHFLLDKGGVAAEDVEIVAIGGAQALLTALESGQIDGFAISLGPDRTAVHRGAVMWVDNLRGDVAGLSPFPMVNLYTTRSYAEENPEIVEKLVQATQRATADLAAKSVDEIFEILQPRYKSMDPEVLRLSIEAFKPALNASGQVSDEMVDNLLTFVGEEEVTSDDYKAHYEPKFLE
jgi:NitT/TauT family transport system substrate-binding protein